MICLTQHASDNETWALILSISNLTGSWQALLMQKTIPFLIDSDK